jgi:hypothetical protein
LVQFFVTDKNPYLPYDFLSNGRIPKPATFLIMASSIIITCNHFCKYRPIPYLTNAGAALFLCNQIKVIDLFAGRQALDFMKGSTEFRQVQEAIYL